MMFDHQRLTLNAGLAGCEDDYVASYATGNLENYLKNHDEHFYRLAWSHSRSDCFLTKERIYFDLPILMYARGFNYEGTKESGVAISQRDGQYIHPKFAAFDPSRDSDDISFPPAFRLGYRIGFTGEVNAVIEKLSFFEDYLKLYHVGTELPAEVRNSMDSKND